MEALNWEAVSVLGSFALACSGVIIWAMKAVAGQIEKRLCDKIDGIKAERRKDAETVTKLKDDFADFKARLPLEYVRREDSIRQETVFHAKLDAIYGELKDLREKLT